MFRLGRAFEKGFGTDVNALEAFKWYQEAAAKDHREAQKAAATIQMTKEFKEATVIESDKLDFQEDLAAIKNLPPALRCEDSHIPLFLEYSNRLYPVKGEPGIELVDSETFLQDLENLNPKRMFQLAVLFQNTRLAPPPLQVISRWIFRAAYFGYIPAATSAGHICSHGENRHPDDLSKATFYFLMAAKAKEPVALRKMWTLRKVIGSRFSFDDLFKSLIGAAEAGEPEAEVILYQYLMENQEARKLYPCDPAKFLNSAAKKGYPRAVKLRKKTRRL